MGAFDDLIPGGEEAEAANAFADLVPAGPRREVGFGEAATRFGAKQLGEAGKRAGLALAAPAVGLDFVANLFRQQPSYPASDLAFSWLVDPSQLNIERNRLREGEALTGGGQAGAVVGSVAGMAPDLVMGAKGVGAVDDAVRASDTVAQAVTRALGAGVAGSQPIAQTQALTTFDDLVAAGVDPGVAGQAASRQFGVDTLTMAAPAATAGRIGQRAVSGAGVNVTGGALADQAANTALEEAGYVEQQRDVLDPVSRGAEAGLGALLGILFGQPAAGRAPRADLGYGAPAPSAEQVLADALIQPSRSMREVVDEQAGVRPEPTGRDRAARRRAATEAFREGGPAVRRDEVMPLEGDLWSLRPGQPEFARDQTGTAPPVDELARRRDVENLRARGVDREAFDVAQAQRTRKQDAQDRSAIVAEESGAPVDPRDLREARAGGTTTREGTEAIAPESFTFLDVKRDRAGNVISTGPQVEVTRTGFTMKDAKGKEVPAAEIGYVDPETGADVVAIVPASRVSELSRPKNPRFSQDIAATTYAPPRGVGTGEQQPRPREAGQRITTEPSPEITSRRPAGPEDRAAPVRTGRDVTDLAFDRLPPQQRALPGEPQRRLEDRRETDEQIDAALNRRAAEEDIEARVEQLGERPRTRNLIKEVRSWGGINSRLARDILGEKGFRANSGTRVFRRDGLDESDLALYMYERGWLSEQEYNDVDGGVQAAKDKIRDSVFGEEVLHPEDAERVASWERARREAEQAALESGLTRNDAPDVDAAARAAEIDPDAFEAAAVRFEDDDEGFNAAIREILENDRRQEADQGAEDRQRRAAGEREEAAAEGTAGRDDFRLERETEAEIRQRERDAALAKERQAREERAAEARERDDRERDDFELTGSDRAADANSRQADIFSMEDERAARRQARDAADELSEENSAERTRRDIDEAVTDSRIADEEAETPRSNPFMERRRQRDVEQALREMDLRGGGDDAGPGTLRSGISPSDIANAFKWLVGDARAWSRNLEGWRDIFKRWPEDPGKRASQALIQGARFALDTAAGDIRGRLKGFDSKTAQWVLDQFAAEAGGKRVTGQTFHDAVQGWSNQQLNRLGKVLDPLNGEQIDQVVRLVRNPGGIRAGQGAVQNAAAEVRKLLDGALKYMREAGVEAGEVRDGYFPREFDQGLVTRKGAEFIQAAAQAYRETGLGAEAAQAAARQLHNTIVFGDTGTIFRADKGNPASPFLKGRVFGKQVDDSAHPLNRFLLNDARLSLPQYFQRVARRAETARRFGDSFEKWGEIEQKIIDEGAGEALDAIKHFVTIGAGLRNPSTARGVMVASSWARTWGSLMFLEKAVLSSLSEFITPAIRSGEVSQIARSLRLTIQDFVKSGDTVRLREFAEDLGLISGHFTDTFNAARFSGGEVIGRSQTKILDNFFKRTYLTQWTEATRIGSIGVGQTFIRRLAKDAKGGKRKNLTARYLGELGVPEGKIDEFARFVLSKNDGNLSAADVQGPMGELYRAAVQRFMNQSIMSPDATNKPRWMSHPLGAIVGQLQSFNYAFLENVWKRNGKLAWDAVTDKNLSAEERIAMLKPLAIMPVLAAAAFGIGEGRDRLLGDPHRRALETGGDKALKAFSRGAPFAPIDPLLNWITSARYDRSFVESFVGPVPGGVAKMLDSVRDYFFKNSPNTNTTERAVARNVYNLVMEPAFNMGLAIFPPSIMTAIATQWIGAGATREAFVKEAAGARSTWRQNDGKRRVRL